MNWLSILFFVIAGICLLLSWMLSSTGESSGLLQNHSFDLELFKRTKDRGIKRIMQLILFILFIVLLIISILVRFY